MIDLRKRKIEIIIIAIAAVVVVCGIRWAASKEKTESLGIIGGADGPTAIVVGTEKEEDEAHAMDKAISEYLISYNKDWYAQGECSGEGHVYLGVEEKDGKTFAYLLTTFGQYGFQDGNFVKISGSGVIPALIVLNENNEVESLRYPLDGSYYESSLKEMFPEEYINKMNKDESRDELRKMEESYAKAYLESIGRDAKIGNYGDFEHVLLVDAGVSVEVSNKVFEYKELEKFPFWIGSQEFIEDGVRYVYEMDYNERLGLISFVKYDYETGTIKESFYLDSKTGQMQ